MVVDSRAKMNKFVMGIFDLVLNDFRLEIFIPSMEILVSWFMPNISRSKSLSKLVGN